MRFSLPVCLFFFISGATGLMYQVIWSRCLGLVFGNTTHAIAAVLAAFMAGLGLGAYLIGRNADRMQRPLFAYGLLELGVGLTAACSFPLLHAVQSAYVSLAHTIPPGAPALTLCRLALAIGVVFIPTFLMGASLPVLARHTIQHAAAIGSSMSRLYAINTAGAVAGTLAAGFYLIPSLGLRQTLAIAVALNLAIGLAACRLARSPQVVGALVPSAHSTASALPSALPIARPRWILPSLAVSGAVAMLYEVAWTRTLATVLSSSTYAFTLMLATVLLGIALGSAAFTRILASRRATPADWIWLLLLQSASALLTLPAFAWISLIGVRIFSVTVGHPIAGDLFQFLVCASLMIIPTFCMGALFPVSVSLYTNDARTVGKSVGLLYLGNTAGNIAGSLAAGFLLIPTVGLHHTLLLAITLAALLAATAALTHRTAAPLTRPLMLVALLLVAAGSWRQRHGWDPRLITMGLHLKPQGFAASATPAILAQVYDANLLSYHEGLNCIVSTHQIGDNVFLRVNGKTDASTSLDRYTQLLSGHIPHLLHPNPQRTLVIGLGSGMTVSAALAHDVPEVDCAELEPGVVEASRWFAHATRNALRNPRLRMIANDGRNHLLVEPRPYDIIVSEPSNPWMAGTATLFTKEFYEIALAHLNPGGILCQWLQAYNLGPSDFRMIIATVQSVFPHVTLWSTLPGDYLIVASRDPIRYDVANTQARFDQLPLVRQDLAEFEMPSPVGILSYMELGEAEAKTFASHAQLNTDDRLILEFSAPRSLHKPETSELNRTAVRAAQRIWPPALSITDAALTNRPDWLVEIARGWLGKPFGDRADAARPYLKRAMELDAANTGAMVGLGRCLLIDDKQIYALSLLTAAAKLSGNVRGGPRPPDAVPRVPNPEARLYAAHAAWKGGDAKNAAAEFGQLAQADPRNWLAHFWLAQTLEELEKFDAAAAAYTACIALDAHVVKVKFGQAHCLLRAGRLAEAAIAIEALRHEYPTDGDIHKELLLIARALGKPEMAITAFEDLVRRNPWRAEYWMKLVGLYQDAGRPRDSHRAMHAAHKTSSYFDEMLFLDSGARQNHRNLVIPAPPAPRETHSPVPVEAIIDTMPGATEK